MVNSKNINWVEKAELKAVVIDKDYGKNETYTGIVLMGVLISLITFIISFFIVINYGEQMLEYVKNILFQNNFFNISLYCLSVISCVVYLVMACFSVKGIVKAKIGINHQVNTKENFVINVLTLIISSFYVLLIVGLTIFRLFIMNNI